MATTPVPVNFSAPGGVGEVKVTANLGATDLATGFTVAAVVRLKTLGQWHSLVTTVTAGDLGSVGLFVNSDDYPAVWIDDSFLGFTAADLVADEWYLLAGTKASGSAAVRQHAYRFSNHTWDRGNGSAVSDTARTPNRIQLGEEKADGSKGDFYGAVWAYWNRDLSDSDLNNLVSNLDAWQAAAPDWWMVGNGSVAMVDETGGTGDETAREANVTSGSAQTSPLQWTAGLRSQYLDYDYSR